MQREIEHWTKAQPHKHLPDNRGWWAQWRTSFGDIVDVQGPFKTREDAERAEPQLETQ